LPKNIISAVFNTIDIIDNINNLVGAYFLGHPVNTVWVYLFRRLM